MAIHYIQPVDPTELASRFSTEDALSPIPRHQEEEKKEYLEKIKDVLDYLPDDEADAVRLYYFLDKNQVDIAEIFNVTQAAISYRLKRARDRIQFLIEMPKVPKDEVYDDLIDIFSNKLDARIFSEIFWSTCQSDVADELGITQGRVRHRFLSNLKTLGQRIVDMIFAWANRQEDIEDIKIIKENLKDLDDENRNGNLEDSDFEDSLQDIISEIRSLPEKFHEEELILFFRYYLTFVSIRYNFNILKKVKLPKWSNRAKHKIS